jgi:hypothetical protein
MTTRKYGTCDDCRTTVGELMKLSHPDEWVCTACFKDIMESLNDATDDDDTANHLADAIESYAAETREHAWHRELRMDAE